MNSVSYRNLYYNSIFKGALQFHYPLSSGIFLLPLGVFFTQRAALQLALLMFLLPSSPRYQFYTLVRCCTYDTGCFQVVTHPGNDLAQPCLTSVIKWEPVYPWWQVELPKTLLKTHFTTLQRRYPEEHNILTTPTPFHKRHRTKLK